MYSIPVKLDGIERRKRSTGLLHIVAGFFLIANAGTYNKLGGYEQFYSVLPIYLLAVISLIYGFLRKRIDPAAQYNHWVRLSQFLIFSILGILMINYGKTMSTVSLFLWALITILLLFTERKIFHDTALLLKGDGIHIPAYFKNHVLPWTLLEGFILRQDYITILRRDKKYVQLELLSSLEDQKIEQINTYAKEQIAQFSQQIIES